MPCGDADIEGASDREGRVREPSRDTGSAVMVRTREKILWSSGSASSIRRSRHHSAIRGRGGDSWFDCSADPKMEALREARFDTPDLAAQQRICREMQQQFWQNRLMCRSASTTSRRRSNIYLSVMADGSSMGCRASKVFGKVCNVLRD